MQTAATEHVLCNAHMYISSTLIEGAGRPKQKKKNCGCNSGIDSLFPEVQGCLFTLHVPDMRNTKNSWFGDSMSSLIHCINKR